jgi:tetratricopeptide (TPR) repeat protein
MPLYGQHQKIDSLQRKLTTVRSDFERTQVLLGLSKASLESDPIASLESAQQALQLATKLSSDSLIAYAYLQQGNAFLHSGSYAKALEFYIRIIPGAIERSDSVLLGVAYANTGNVYYYDGDFEKALKNDFLSLEYLSGSSDKSRLLRKANLLSNIGTIYEETRQFEKAEKYYDDAYAIGLVLNNHELLGNVLNNRGTLYRDQGNDERALKYYEEALLLREKNNNRFGMARSNFSLGVYYFNHKNYTSATQYLQRSVDLGNDVGSLQTVSSAAAYLYRAQREIGDYKNAMESLELSRQTEDSLYNEQTTRKIAQLEMQSEFDKQQKQIEAQQKQKELYYLLGASMLIVLLLIAVILFLIQRNKVRKGQIQEAKLQLERVHLKNDIEMKDKELATNVMFLIEKNELINTISEKLLDIKTGIPAESQGALHRVIMDLQSNFQPALWQEFEFRFQQVYETFYRVLTERFPDLSPGERRLCAFLKLNMTTKEISALTHQNSKSIDVARTRLRKKLGLTGMDQNLVTFLEQLDASKVQA